MITFEFTTDKENVLHQNMTYLSTLGISYKVLLDDGVYSVEGKSQLDDEEFFFWLAEQCGIDVFDIQEVHS